jgi:leucyl/phenylalanyl-tRNA--protein transferase
MVDAYIDFHHAGYAHSVETWVKGEMVAGLYFVAMGRAVFGESMFTRITDGSKIALAALVALCRAHEVPQLDCQQVTTHLARLGARPVQRAQFLGTMQLARTQMPVPWEFSPESWTHLHQA